MAPIKKRCLKADNEKKKQIMRQLSETLKMTQCCMKSQNGKKERDITPVNKQGK